MKVSLQSIQVIEEDGTSTSNEWRSVHKAFFQSTSAVALQPLVGLGLLQESIPFLPIAVSYTHLDVYKRQV